MSRRFPASATTLLLLIVTTLLFYSCGPDLLDSYWLRPSDMKAGHPDWEKLGSYKFDQLEGSASIANDSSTLYLQFASRDRRLAGRFRRAGLTIWLTNPKDRNERLGIGYPIPRNRRIDQSSPDMLPGGNMSPEQLMGLLDVQNDMVLFTSPDSLLNGRMSLGDAADQGALPHLTADSSFVEYSLRLDFGRDAPWIKPGSRILVTIDSPAMKRPDREGGFRERGGRPRGGFGPGEDDDEGGMGGFPRRGRGGMGRGEHEEQRQPEGIPFNRALHVEFELDIARPGS